MFDIKKIFSYIRKVLSKKLNKQKLPQAHKSVFTFYVKPPWVIVYNEKILEYVYILCEVTMSQHIYVK